MIEIEIEGVWYGATVDYDAETYEVLDVFNPDDGEPVTEIDERDAIRTVERELLPIYEADKERAAFEALVADMEADEDLQARLDREDAEREAYRLAEYFGHAF